MSARKNKALEAAKDEFDTACREVYFYAKYEVSRTNPDYVAVLSKARQAEVALKAAWDAIYKPATEAA